ncbi:hypothetical protein ACFL6U_24265 [Planctomycetota bacterium]
MQSRLGKIAIAAVVVFAVIIGLNSLSGPGASGVAWGEVQAAVEQTPTVIYSMTNEIEGMGNQVYYFSEKVYNGGSMGLRIDSFMEGNLTMQKFINAEEGTAYHIRNDRKKYTRKNLEGGAWHSEKTDPRNWLKVALSEDYEELGASQINGIEVEGIEVQNSTLLGEDGGVVRIWVDPSTNLPVRMELKGLMLNEGANRPMTFLMEDFEWDVEIDPELLKPNIPDDYQELESFDRAPREEQKPHKTLTDDEQSAQTKVKEVARLFLEASSRKDWPEMLKHRPGFQELTEARRNQFDTIMGDMEIVHLGEPFKTDDSDIWHVPGQIKGSLGIKEGEILRVRYDEALGRYVVCGGP